MKGILTIATKHALYGRYAYNLAVSVKANAPEIPISIIADAVGISHLNPSQLSIFDNIITPDPDDYQRKGYAFAIRKMRLNITATTLTTVASCVYPLVMAL